MVYSELEVKNFVFDHSPNLYFVDLGSFQLNYIIGQLLVGSKFYDFFDKSLFKRYYISGGDSDYIFKNDQLISLVKYIYMSANQPRAYINIRLTNGDENDTGDNAHGLLLKNCSVVWNNKHSLFLCVSISPSICKATR